MAEPRQTFPLCAWALSYFPSTFFFFSLLYRSSPSAQPCTFHTANTPLGDGTKRTANSPDPQETSKLSRAQMFRFH